MNAYDFDGTIYNGDSGRDFVKFAFFKKVYYNKVNHSPRGVPINRRKKKWHTKF